MSFNDPFGYMNYNPNISDGSDVSGICVPYAINPLDIQICYKKLFDIYCGSFVEKQGEFLSLLRVYNGDYRRTVISIENVHLSKETEKMDEVFKAKL